MKVLAFSIMVAMMALLASAKSRPSSFNHFDIVALVNVTNGKVKITVLHCVPDMLDEIEHDKFHAEIVKWAAPLKDRSLVYAMVIQDGQKRSATWEIAPNTYAELEKIASAMLNANVRKEVPKVRFPPAPPKVPEAPEAPAPPEAPEAPAPPKDPDSLSG